MKVKREVWLLLLVNGFIVLNIIFRNLDLLAAIIDDEVSPYVLLESDLTPVTYQPVKKVVDYVGNEEIQMEPDRKLIIPKLIHQTYKNFDIPDKWNQTYKSIRVWNPDYTYMFWTDENSREFIEGYYPWFLETYDSYPYNIMRADVIRYFALWHFGGIYMDLDNGCDINMDPMLAFPAWFRKTDPTGISNDVMGSVPRHPFMLHVLNNLKNYNRNYHISYLTIMYSTGPLFLSVMFKQYLNKQWPSPGGDVRVLVPPDLSKYMINFFSQLPGSSWHQGDAWLIQFLGRHVVFTVLLVCGLIFGFLYAQYKLYQDPALVLANAIALTNAVVVRARRAARYVYRVAAKQTQGTGTGSPLSSRSGSPIDKALRTFSTWKREFGSAAVTTDDLDKKDGIVHMREVTSTDGTSDEDVEDACVYRKGGSLV